jgi:hypothetical protein
MNHNDTDQRSPQEEHGGHGRHSGHSRWMMIACCVPMLAIAVAIAVSGAGAGFLLIAVMCTAMMAMMMGGMSGKGGDSKGQ